MKKENILKSKFVAMLLLACICMCELIGNTKYTVLAVENSDKNVEAAELDLGDYQSEMKVGEKQLLSVTVLPETAADTTITYSSSNPKTAKVNGMGRITALAAGTTEIKVACGGVSEKFTLTVVSAENTVRDIDLGDCPSEIEVGSSQLLSVTLIPSDTAEQGISYSTSNPKIAAVNEIGRVTGIAVGKVTITVSSGGIKKEFSLKVVEAKSDNKPVTAIEIADHEDELEVDKTMSLSVTVLPADATDNTVTYKSSDEKIATVNSSGEVKGIEAGKVTITVSAGDISKKVELTVKYATSKIELNTTYLVMKVGETFQLKVNVLPAKADQKITYESVNTEIVSISSGGLVTAKQCGNGTILVKNSDTSTAVAVIVNDNNTETGTESKKQDKEADAEYENVIYAKDCPLITSDMLQYFYEKQMVLTIYGTGYSMQIDGKRISNWDNEMYTALEFTQEKNGTSFNLNRSKNICGIVAIQLDESVVSGKYIYLYNDSKNKYELLNQEDIHLLELDSAGKYLIAEKKLGNRKIKIVVIVIAVIVVLAMVAAYIVIKKRYWFW